MSKSFVGLVPVDVTSFRDTIRNILVQKIDPKTDPKIIALFDNKFDNSCHFSYDHYLNHADREETSRDVRKDALRYVEENEKKLSKRNSVALIKRIFYADDGTFVVALCINAKYHYMIISFVNRNQSRGGIKNRATRENMRFVDVDDKTEIEFHLRK